MISFKVSHEAAQLIIKIVTRAERLFAEHGVKIDRMTLDMDITAAHANGCPLKLDELLAAPEFDFAHDVAGIQRHINRKTGELGDCFLPRYADVERMKREAGSPDVGIEALDEAAANAVRERGAGNVLAEFLGTEFEQTDDGVRFPGNIARNAAKRRRAEGK